MRALWLVALVACGARTELGATADASDDCGASLASNASWTTSFGPARDVCLTASDPTGCPSDALHYGLGPGWAADISSLDGARWIWRPGISLSDIADDVEVTFSRTFVLPGSPTGTISIAADDYAEVRVNGDLVGSVGSTTDESAASAAQNALTTFDLAPHLVPGANTITVVARNGPASFACGNVCTYAQNPAGVVFGGRLSCR